MESRYYRVDLSWIAKTEENKNAINVNIMSRLTVSRMDIKKLVDKFISRASDSVGDRIVSDWHQKTEIIATQIQTGQW